MATLYVKDVPPSVYAALKDRAARSGRSLSAEVRMILESAVPAKRSRAEVVAATRRLQQEIGKPEIDAVQSIRDDRDSR